ncbi:NAD(P)-binding protein [Setomelanomma holmii]|uniref:NAD(P)-binding protein n=1 Tax=Setomelanomma holmii TaxID=210430 RepID=A0A9P4LL47_9PLEO|nr:NAD(P)-binding protein [Setomelanomma holmii]
MSHSILLTGASGYLGGSLLTYLHTHRAALPPHKTLYALVRTPEQGEAVKSYGAVPLYLDLQDEDAVTKAILDAEITIVYFLIDALKSDAQLRLIKALGEVKKQTGLATHFLHTSGAKIFSQHAGFPTDRKISDADPELFAQSKQVEPPFNIMKTAVRTNQEVVETAEKYGVRSYIFIPCIVYGQGSGFGNKISIQTVAVVKAAKGVGAVYDINPENYTWPVCHIEDNTALYASLLATILLGDNPGHGKNGYYLASSGSVAWRDIYIAMAKALAKRQVVKSDKIEKADDAALEEIGKALGCPIDFVGVQFGGKCTLTADHGHSVSWRAKYNADHVLEAADAEIELILKHLKD